MTSLTILDLTNASRYATHMHRLNFIPRWRTKFPHIFVDYEIRPANNDDYYVPPKLAERAIAVSLKFSKVGCESMSCYPFHETGPADYATPFGYTQTSDVAVGYAQPACYNLDRAMATREGAENEVQSPELRYIENGNKCILVDTLSKMYMNSPYLRTDEHLIQGVDDVPGFNVTPSDDPLFPEMFKGEFNEAYCRRFGRELINGGCSLRWWESLIGFVLGDTIYVTFKLMANNIFSELRHFDYTRPSPELPTKPAANSAHVLDSWLNQRDSFVDLEREIDMVNFETLSDLGINENVKLIYRAQNGFSKESISKRIIEERIKLGESGFVPLTNEIDNATLDEIISQFLEDHAFLFGILTSIGFDVVFDQLKAMLKKINSSLIPLLKRVLLTSSKQVTVKLLGETYKAAIVHSFNRIAIKTISAVAKAMTKIAIKAASVVGILLILLTITDLVLMLWDPFGYSNMFPREFPDDMSRSFLSAYFESMGETRDMIEFLPEFFDDLIEEDDEAMFDSLFYILDYVSALEVNSNGQLLNFEDSKVIDDFDEVTLVGSVLASSSMYSRLEFMLYTERHNNILYHESGHKNLAYLWFASALIIYFLPHTENVIVFFVIFLLIGMYMFFEDSFKYFLTMRSLTDEIGEVPWFQNLY
ncbi:p74/pif0 [Cryptophlebia peltastica nucleopolyhedrovirus]|uniref:p74/pif0 n=1 Tax=Cryptophlebia peltastica nucleopolyhedrovirus TaxID=2304025 RepID=A0A346RNN2_9ABAC|nr:p74/pif0 [Cryptophlebia peltastica nucleopolyhedrovirus]AXS67679.1 p74/pif0 [Cryptophlebia peltastica nucleopolyhedrovirus]